MLDCLILCARQQEGLDISAVLKEKGRRIEISAAKKLSNFGAIAYEISSERGNSVRIGLVNCGDMGNVSAAARTGYFLNAMPANLVIFCGIAGSLNPKKARLGDVIIPTKVHSYWFDKITDQDPIVSAALLANDCVEMMADRQIAHRSTSALEFISPPAQSILLEIDHSGYSNLLKNFDLPGDWSKNDILIDRNCSILKEDDIFSWELVFNSVFYRNYLSANNRFHGAVAVDMESYGFLKAMSGIARLQKEVAGIIVRGISDYVGHKDLGSDTEKLYYRNIALQNATNISIKIALDQFDRKH